MGLPRCLNGPERASRPPSRRGLGTCGAHIPFNHQLGGGKGPWFSDNIPRLKGLYKYNEEPYRPEAATAKVRLGGSRDAFLCCCAPFAADAFVLVVAV